MGKIKPEAGAHGLAHPVILFCAEIPTDEHGNRVDQQRAKDRQAPGGRVGGNGQHFQRVEAYCSVTVLIVTIVPIQAMWQYSLSGWRKCLFSGARTDALRTI